MWELILIGLIGGLVTGLSPCILPVLPIVLAVSADKNRKPILVATGIAISFTLVTLLGTLALKALGLPTGTLRWAGVILLILVGLSMLWPQLGDLLERPFSRIRVPGIIQRATRRSGSGFSVGLALGAVYSPCAGPVLAAVTVAGATGRIGWGTVALAVAFAVGACTPLFFFALAGQRISARASFVRSHRRTITRASGVMVVALATAIALDLPATLQRTLPDVTASVQEKFNGSALTQGAIGALPGASSSSSLDACRSADPSALNDCGEVPAFEGLGAWINADSPVDPRHPGARDGHQTITLVDFWAYACINCQRANQHITALYDRYKDSGLTVVGVHSPEYGFEHDLGNVRQAVQDQHIHYPVVQDNDFATWEAFHNRYWPAHYLVDHNGQVRHIHEGEGAYAQTETLIRTLLTQANPGIQLPDRVEQDEQGDAASHRERNPETYLGTARARFFDNPAGSYRPGRQVFSHVNPGYQRYSLDGAWELSPESLTPADATAQIYLNYLAARVQLVVSGRGQLTLTHEDGRTETLRVEGDGAVDLINREALKEQLNRQGSQAQQNRETGSVEKKKETMRISVPRGISVYSFTFG